MPLSGKLLRIYTEVTLPTNQLINQNSMVAYE